MLTDTEARTMRDVRSGLCIFAKQPLAGYVKTRLAAQVGQQAAAELARGFLSDTLRRAESFPWGRVFLALSGDPRALGPLSPGVTVWDQGSGDLGARQERVLQRALAEAPRAIALGADSPTLPRHLLEGAHRALQTHDAVLGPSADGGYYLLGLRRCPEGLLAELPWSAPETCQRTAARLEERGLSLGWLDPWYDVDTLEDLHRLRSELAESQVDAPATRAVVARLLGPAE